LAYAVALCVQLLLKGDCDRLAYRSAEERACRELVACRNLCENVSEVASAMARRHQALLDCPPCTRSSIVFDRAFGKRELLRIAGA
jgi:hypothetical protein